MFLRPAVSLIVLTVAVGLAGCGATTSSGSRSSGGGVSSASSSTSTKSSSPEPKPAAAKVVDSGHGSGHFAIADASGEVDHPSKIKLHVTSSPAQSGSVRWTIDCQESSGGVVGSKSGQKRESLPVTQTLPLPASPQSCEVTANVRLDTSGTVRIAILG
jgi:hypothetical protein